jgi:stress response protein YsnF
MNEKSIDERIKEKRNELVDVHGVLALHMSKELTYSQRAKASELQDRLEFRLKQYEEKLLDEKLEIYKEVVKTLKS